MTVFTDVVSAVRVSDFCLARRSIFKQTLITGPASLCLFERWAWLGSDFENCSRLAVVQIPLVVHVLRPASRYRSSMYSSRSIHTVFQCSQCSFSSATSQQTCYRVVVPDAHIAEPIGFRFGHVRKRPTFRSLGRDVKSPAVPAQDFSMP